MLVQLLGTQVPDELRARALFRGLPVTKDLFLLSAFDVGGTPGEWTEDDRIFESLAFVDRDQAHRLIIAFQPQLMCFGRFRGGHSLAQPADQGGRAELPLV